MAMDNYSLSDIAAATGADGFGGNMSGWWIILFFILCGFGGNGWGGNGFQNAIGYENLATSNEVQRGFDNQNSMANQRDILAAVNSGTAQGIAATNQTFHDTLGFIQNTYNELQRDVAGIAVGQANALANQNQCCCDTKMLIAETGAGINANIAAQGAMLNAGIAQNRYDAAMQTAQLSQQIDARFNQLELSNAQRENEQLRQRMNALENSLQTAQLQSDIAASTSNVMRWPTTWAYNAGMPPVCGCGTGCCNV